MATASPVQQRWSLDSIDWRSIRRDAVAESEALFYLVAAASFMESTTDRYTRNLIDRFFGDDEITSWLERHWLLEEIQHGHALRRYVQIAWPDFEWDRVYESFLEEFSSYCSADGLEPTRTREMASRCVVETGTASFYTTLSRISHDPVLATMPLYRDRHPGERLDNHICQTLRRRSRQLARPHFPHRMCVQMLLKPL